MVNHLSLVTIAKAWYSMGSSNPYFRSRANARLEVCDVCPNKRQMSRLGQILMSFTNAKDSVYKCNQCGCPLSALVVSEDKAACRLNKWKQ